MSNTIAQNLAAIKNIKDNLRIQINAKGVSLSASAPFSSYPTAVAAISGGGGEVPEDYVRDYANRIISETARESVFGTDDVVRVVPSEYKCIGFSLNSDLTRNGGLLVLNNYSATPNSSISASTVLPLSTADSWEFRTVYKQAEHKTQCIIGSVGYSDRQAPQIKIGSNNTMAFCVSSNGSSWDISGLTSASYSFIIGTYYYIKAGFTGNSYYYQCNTSGWDFPFETISEVESTTKCYCTAPFTLMNTGYDSNNLYNTGVMDLSQTKWIINGSDYLVCGTLTTSTL